MLLVLIVFLILLPFAELYVLIKAGSVIGAGTTILIVIGSAIFGASLAKQQGREILFRAQGELNQGRVPTEQLLQGLLVFVGGIFLIAPGFITDVLGLLMVLPPTRFLLTQLIKRVLAARLRSGRVRVYRFGGPFGRPEEPFSTMGIRRDLINGDDDGDGPDDRPPARDVTPKKPESGQV